MTTQNQNPFILPGLGQTGDMAGNPLLASMEMMRQAWEGLAKTGGLDGAMAAPMSVDDLDRRIKDLRAVENWLRMNLSMLSSTIQGMEVQRSTLATLKSFMAGAAASAAQPDAKTTPFDAFWALWQANAGQEAPAAGTSDTKPQRASSAAPDKASAGRQAEQPPEAGQAGKAGAAPGTAQPDAAAAGIPPALAAQAMAASQGWWDMVQTQFDNLATATSASLQSAQPVPPGSTAETGSTLDKSSGKAAPASPAARKAPAKRATTGTKRKPAAKRPVRKSPSSGS